MTISSIVLIAGLALIIVALVGGGIEAKEVKIPQLPIWPRVASFLVGCILIGLVVFDQKLFESPEPGLNPVTADKPRELGAAIINHLIEVVQVKTILDHLGFYNGPINNDVDDTYFKAVGKFQQAKNITQDGLVGPETLGKLQEAWPEFFNRAKNQ